ncbi:MAG: hypothetical protein IKR76_08690 [Ruminococcus sp.]|nr:hypothetical protein [Ruminococcus sp.]
MKRRILITAAIVLLAAVAAGVCIYKRANSPFAWKYQKEIADAFEESDLQSIEYSGVREQGGGYKLHFDIQSDKVTEQMLRDAVKAQNIIKDLSADSSNPMHGKNIVIDVSADKGYTEGYISLWFENKEERLSVGISNSTVQDFSCINDRECRAVELTIVHDELFDPERIFEIKNITKLSIVDCYDISRDAHQRITLDDELTARLKREYQGIEIENS